MLIGLGCWLLARAGVEFQLGPAELAVHALRDKRGRFRPRDGGGYGLPRDVPHEVADLLFDMGVTPEMYKGSAVPLVLPDDIEDVRALERRLREWVVANINHWVGGERRSLRSVIEALKDTYAINYYFFKPPKRFVRANRQDAETPREDSHAVAVSHRSDPFQGVVGFEQNLAFDPGARAFCPPVAFQQAAPSSAEPNLAPASDPPTFDLPLDRSEVVYEPRAECPRSVPGGNIEKDRATAWKASLRGPPESSAFQPSAH